MFFFALFCCFSIYCQEEEVYEFLGNHLIANYIGCDKEAIRDLKGLEAAMKGAAIASGAHIITTASHVFPPDGFMMVILLSESHASIHTYPEYDSCFVDCFTCGEHCDPSKFDQVLSSYLKPQQAQKRILVRGSEN